MQVFCKTFSVLNTLHIGAESGAEQAEPIQPLIIQCISLALLCLSYAYLPVIHVLRVICAFTPPFFGSIIGYLICSMVSLLMGSKILLLMYSIMYYPSRGCQIPLRWCQIWMNLFDMISAKTLYCNKQGAKYQFGRFGPKNEYLLGWFNPALKTSSTDPIQIWPCLCIDWNNMTEYI